MSAKLSKWSLKQAYDIKNTVWDNNERHEEEEEATTRTNSSSWFSSSSPSHEAEEGISRIDPSLWFSPPSRSSGSFSPASSSQEQCILMNYVSYDSINKYADQEYDKWRRVHPEINYSNNSYCNLQKWVEHVDVETLAWMLQNTPKGVTTHKDYKFNPYTANACDETQLQAKLTYEFKFTAWQRLSMAHWSNFLFDVTSEVFVDVRDITQTTSKIPMQAQYTMLKGSFPDVGIIDLPTASGKTAWSCCVGFLAVRSDYFPLLVEQYRMKKLNTMLQGLPEMCVARMVLIATAANTYDHYVNTVHGLIPEFKRLDPASKFVLWLGSQRNYSIKAASEHNSSIIIFWIVPVKQVNAVLRATPGVAVAVCIMDEFTIDTPREKSMTAKSAVVKHMITQATPQALVQATRGNVTWLKHLFRGTITPPKDIYRYIVNHEFKKAREACEQLCTLDLCTMSAYRKVIRNELRQLMPPGLDIYFVYSRRMTLSAHLAKSSTELVPLRLPEVLLRSIANAVCAPLKEAADEFKESLKNVDHARAIISALEKLLSTYEPRLIEGNSNVSRLMERINEFTVACPICLMGDRSTLRAFGCCGYCICDDCFDRCVNQCPFCRTPIELVPKSAEDNESDPTTSANAQQLQDGMITYPEAAESIMNSGDNFASRLTHFVSTRYNHGYNLTMCLHVLREHSFNRILILIESSYYYQTDMFSFSSAFSVENLSGVTNIDIRRIDDIMSGRGTEFSNIKRRFDTTNDTPMALLSYGMDPNILVGTNFDYVDAIVTLGDLPLHNLTQALARTFRPRASRDNSKSIVMIKLHH